MTISTDPVGTSTADADQFLTLARKPGGGNLRTAAAWRVGAITALVLWWECVAHLVAGGSFTLWGALGLLALLLGAGCRACAARAEAAGQQQIARWVQSRTLAAATRPHAIESPARLAHETIELAQDVASYHRAAAPAALAAGPSCAVVLIVVAWQHWPVAVLLLLTTPFIPANLRLAGLSARDASERQLADVRRLSDIFLDRFAALRTLRSLGAAEREAATVEAAAADLSRSTMRVLRRAFVSAAVLDTIVTFAIAIAATYVGLTLLGYLHLPGGDLDLATGLAVLLLVPLYYEPLRAVAGGYHEKDRAQAAAAVLMHDADAPAMTSAAPMPEPPAVQLSGVTVRLHGRTVLRDVTATAAAGAVVALVGPSGSGKTTLLQCISGMRIPTSGITRWVSDGQSVEPTPGAASWIGQRTVILPDTLGDNIRLGHPTAGDDRVARAAAGAGLTQLVDSLPAGLDEPVGDGGHPLSAGEARRVAVARAILRGSALWLLDEPTAHLDARTEQDVLDGLLAASAGRTVVIATHSPALIERADVVWRIERATVHVEERT
ncbi:ATP-binding cassette domain-containing protein [Flexivirga meconopsidis]|uniref:ATP-binding cassette domain-containing protein n=1 Tax=Flexivirga meconopsidis TaxID=2977121 RepID=UPI00223FDE3C|nr:ATP-binding cassette domain-containing protein [Flexivirga meconopsidis]